MKAKAASLTSARLEHREIDPAFEQLNLQLVPYSRQEVDYPAMRQMHEASSLISKEEVAAWRKQKFGKRPALEAKGALIAQSGIKTQ